MTAPIDAAVQPPSRASALESLRGGTLDLLVIGGGATGCGLARDAALRGLRVALVEREDGSWLVSGAASADLLGDRLGVNLPADRDYSTVAGFALSVLKHLPETGETFRYDGWSVEIVDRDGRKIDKLIASRARKKAPEAQAEAAG